MAKTNAELKKEFDAKLAELDLERKAIVNEYKEKIRQAKIEKIRNTILKK
ncbi:MAG: hypothetical protein WCO65_02175 [bacterium]